MDDKYSFDLRTRLTNGGIEVTQDVSSHLEWAKSQREMSKQQRLDRGFKPYCNIPDSVSLDIMTKYGINIHSGTHNKDDLKKVKEIIKREYPRLMYH